MIATIEERSLQPLCHVVSPIGMLGYGVDAKQTDDALRAFTATGLPTALILDSGSTDSGPQKLALGGMTVPRISYARDLRKLLASARRFNVPLIFSSAGGSGTDNNTRELVQIVEELAVELKTGELEVVALFSDIDKELVKERLRSGGITGCGTAVPPLTESDIDEATVIASQMGPEPFIDALQDHPDLSVLVGGRAYDPSPFIAFAEYSYQKLNPETATNASRRFGGFVHMGKIMECAGLCAQPKGGGALATIYVDGTFDITPMVPSAICTPLSVAAHTLYEKSRPDKLYGPGGYLDLMKSEYQQLDDNRTVRVQGGEFVFSVDEGRGVYQIKLEGAKNVGYRAMYVGAHKDPILNSQLDEFLANIHALVTEAHEGIPGPWELGWHTYGKGSDGGVPEEVCVIGEARAVTQELATSIASLAKIGSIHAPYRGQKATSGNFCHGIGGVPVIPLGQCAEFCVYHLMDLKAGEERLRCDTPLFRVESFLVGQYCRKCNGVPNTIPQLQNGNGVNGEKATTSRRKAADLAKQLQSPRLTSLPPNPTLGDLSKVVRSKNAGPYEITFDVMFELEEVYRAVKDANILNDDTVTGLFKISPDQVIWSGFFDQARAYKLTVPRIRNNKRVPAGGFMEDDVHGAQMYLPLMNLQLPVALSEKVQEILTKIANAEVE